MTQVTFTSTKYPALMIRIEGRSFKFSGQKLVVSGDDVDLIHEWASRKPEYGITSDASFELAVPAKAAPEPVKTKDTSSPQGERESSTKAIASNDAPESKPASGPAPNAEHPTLPELRRSLRAMGLPHHGTRDEVEARIAAGYGEDVVYKGEVTDEASE